LTVGTATDLAVNVPFFTAYRFKQMTTERWSNGHLVNLNATTDNNGTRHKVAVRSNGEQLQLTVDGKTSRLDNDIVPSTLWNPEFLRHSVMLDVGDGKVMPVSVLDDGADTLKLDGNEVRAHHYTIKARYSEGVWYDGQGRLVRVRVIGPDGLQGCAEANKPLRHPVSSATDADGVASSTFRQHAAPQFSPRLPAVAKLASPCVRIAPHMSDRGRSHTAAGRASPAPGSGPQFSRSGELS
jgi:hypothetical protein